MDEFIREAKYQDFEKVFLLLEQLWPDTSLDKEKLVTDSESRGLGIGTKLMDYIKNFSIDCNCN